MLNLVQKNMKRIFTYMMAGVSLLATTSCSDFLNTAPYDALAPSNTWKTEGDAEKFLIGCYDGWIDESGILIGIALPIRLQQFPLGSLPKHR